MINHYLLNRAHSAMRVVVVVMLVIILPATVLRSNLEAQTTWALTSFWTFIALLSGLAAIALARFVQTWNVVAPRNRLTAPQLPLMTFSARLDSSSYRWIAKQVPSRLLKFAAAETLAVLITPTGLELWWAPSVMSPQVIQTIKWNQVLEVGKSGAARVDRKIVILLATQQDLILVVAGGSLLPASSHMMDLYRNGITRALSESQAK